MSMNVAVRDARRWSRREWALALGVALALRVLVAFVLLGRMPLVHDAESYVELARQLLANGSRPEGYYWPPGNSFVLAAAFRLLGSSDAVARVVMVLVSVAQVALTAPIARELTRDPRAVRAATWIAALYVPAIALVGQSYAQHLAALCLLAFAFFALKAIRGGGLCAFVLAGGALGLGCLTRPSMASVVPVLAVGIVLAVRRAKLEKSSVVTPMIGAAVLVAVAAGIVAPVLAHNHALGAGWTISTNNERNLFLGNNPYTPNYKTSHLGQRSLDQLEPETRAYLESFYTRPDDREAMKREAIDFIVHHPGTTAYRTLNRATSFWGFDYLASRIVQEHMGWGTKKLLPMLALEAGAYLAVIALALVALFGGAGADRDRFTMRWLVALALAYEAPYAVAFSGGTYHFPVVGLIVPIAALALAAGPRAMLAHLRASRAAWIALGVLAVVQAQYAYYSLTMSG